MQAISSLENYMLLVWYCVVISNMTPYPSEYMGIGESEVGIKGKDK